MRRLAALLLLAAPLARADDGGLAIETDHLRSTSGVVRCLLFPSGEGFPSKRDRSLQRVACPIEGGKARCPFPGVTPGRYAIACFHDENGNDRMDTNLFGIPREGHAASNDAQGHLGPPSFDAAAFRFEGKPLLLRATMRY